MFSDFINEEETVKDLTPEEISKIKKFYHATAKGNLADIMDEGIKVSPEGVVYLADSYANSARFIALHGIKDIISFEIPASKLGKGKIKESYDHDYNFFKCRAYVYEGNIPASALNFNNIMQWNL